MTKKKNAEITQTDDIETTKSLPLFALWRSDLIQWEYRVLDVLLSCMGEKKSREITFKKGEFEKLLGKNRISREEIMEALTHLLKSTAEIPMDKSGFRLIKIFESADAWPDRDDLWEVRITCTSTAMNQIFTAENLNYLRYKLRCITSITSRYTYAMFTYLESNRHKGSWEILLPELKKLLGCENTATYAQYKEFNKQVLKRVQGEILEKTECRYTYEGIRKGRSVTSIRFTLEDITKILEKIEDPNQITISEWINKEERKDS